MMAKPVTTEEFAAALAALGQLPESYKAFLRAHHRMPGRASTAANLSEVAGYRSWRTVNLQYGRLANRIARQLGRPADGLGLLVEFGAPRSVTNEQWLLIMRPEFAGALSKARVLDM